MDESVDPFRPLGEDEASGAATPPRSGAGAWQPEIPAPEAPPDATAIRHPRHGPAAAAWVYRDDQGRPLVTVARFDLTHPDGSPVLDGKGKRKKEMLPLTFGTLCGKRGWHFRAPPAPRPLYGLDRLAQQPDAPVLLSEGEKAADKAEVRFPEYVAVTWQGGADAVGKSEWSALAGRHVVIAPDNDQAGRDAAARLVPLLREAGVADVRIMAVPPDWPDGWDLADPLPDGVTPDLLARLLDEAAEPPAVDEACANPDDAAAPLPPGFVLRPQGVFLRTEDADKPDVHVCGPLRVVAATHDGDGQSWGVLLQWEDGDGRRHGWAMPRALLAGDASEVRARLLDGGLFVGTSRGAREALSAYLLRAEPGARVRVVPRPGWHDTPAGPVFVLRGETLGPASAGRIMLEAERSSGLPPLARSGTLEDWQRQVAAPCIGNSRLVLALSAAFTAPLLAPFGAEGGGIHVIGGSSVGKTTALKAAGSVWGGGGPNGWVRTWRTTDNAAEASAAAHCDLLMCLDEMGECAPETAGALAYMLANGAGKGRAGRDGGARRVPEWRLLFLSTGEVGLTELMAQARGGPRRPTAGQQVRVVELRADAGAGSGLFENLHGEPDGSAFAKRLSAAARRLYGTAGRAFLDRLTADPERLAAAANEARRRFVARHVPEGAAGQVRRVADRFALLAAAGEMAIALGVLPFPAEEAAAAAAARCFADWLEAREGGVGAAEDAAAVVAVQRFLIAHESSRFETLGGDDDAPSGERIINRVGWRKRLRNGERCFVIPCAMWPEVVAGLDPSNAAAALRRAGYLVPQSEKGPRHTRMERVGPYGSVRAYVVRATILADAPESEPPA